MLAKSSGLAVDSIAYDLEDSVTVEKKSEARANLQELFTQPKGPNIKERAIRINAIGSGFEEDDMKAVVQPQKSLLPST